MRIERLENPEAIRLNEQKFILSDASSLDELIEHLNQVEADFVESDLRWAAKILGWKTFKAGHYLLHSTNGFEQVLSKLGRGLQDPVKYRLRPGQTPGRLAKSFSWSFKADSAAFFAAISDTLKAEQLGLSLAGYFGRMLPATYEFYWDSKPEKIIEGVLSEFNRKVAQLPFSSSALDLNDALALASIVEWEAARDDEKPRIAGLYVNRLNRRMRLQADPTVNYAIGERRRLYYDDYRVNHPFNTYKIRGLPPGPITNPSLSSIRAALQPEKHDYLYMVAEKGGTGYHVFTKTYADHRRESRKWTKWLREQYRIKELKEQEEALSES